MPPAIRSPFTLATVALAPSPTREGSCRRCRVVVVVVVVAAARGGGGGGAAAVVVVVLLLMFLG